MLIPAYAIRRMNDEDHKAAERSNHRLNEYTDIFKPELKDPSSDGKEDIIEQFQDDIGILRYASRTEICYKFLIYMTIGFVALYLLSPLDILPEASLGLIGYIDDIGIILLGCWILHSLAERFIRKQRARARRNL
mmetsp:Transcript_16530/g.29680  ORF Transcript_16530/g.29680 Transcript_16530/m.29680 type:complete len:135 (-) Transcript_16530:183-587(-)